MRAALASFGLALFAAGCGPPQSAAPPSTSVTRAGPMLSLACDGPLRPDMTRADLERLFGAENVADQTVPGPEGTETQATVLFPTDPMRRLEIVWGDEAARTGGVSLARTREKASEWMGPAGLRIGSSIADVETVNGKPFQLYGFNWDYGGYANDWRGGALGTASGCAIGVRFNPKEGAPQEGVTGEGPFASDLAAMRAAEPAISELSLGFPVNRR